jgi:hypothetical protein
MSDPWVVDTNVGIVANGRDEDGPHRPESILACVEFLKQILEGSVRIAIDDRWEIIREYKNDLHSSGQPGTGDRFLKWVLINNANPERCDQIDIDAIPAPEQLEDFDPSDIKFIRTALGCPKPQIAEGTDGLWWYRRADFEAAGIEVNFLCQAEIKVNSDRKHGPS